MAKFLLRLFGGGSILLGILSIVGGILTENGIALSIAVYAGSGFLLFGAPLLGFARVISLLEDISANTIGMRRPLNPEDPRHGNHSVASVTRQGEYLGFPYTVHGDDAVVSKVRGDPMTWRNETEFKRWADQQPPR
jgi:hypothetical protein